MVSETVDEDRPRRRSDRWHGVIGGTTSFLVEAVIVAIVALVALVIAAMILVLV